MNTYIFHVSGTHCHSCKILIEDMLKKEPGVSQVSVNLSHQTLEVKGEIADTPEVLAERYSALLAPHNYHLSVEKHRQSKGQSSTFLALPIGVFVLASFLALQRSGILNFGFAGGVTPWTALLIGIIASLSTCLAVVGGLVLSLSAKMSQEVSTARPFFFFHAGRLIGFALLGGVLGLIGASLSLSPAVTTTFGIIAASVMIILGINLLDLFHPMKRLQLTLPRIFFDRLTTIENGFFAPFIVGVGTFFLPCGFTQAMQIASLSSASFSSGMLIMGMFALGTLPMLTLLSFGSFRFAHTRFAPLFFKTAGVVVVGFGLFALSASLASLGIIRPLLSI